MATDHNPGCGGAGLRWHWPEALTDPLSPRRRKTSPPAVTLAALGGLFGAAFALGISASTGSAGSRKLVASPSWVAWLLVGALALVIFAALLLLALRILRTGPEWGLGGPGTRTRNYLIIAAVTVAVIATVIVLVGGTPDIPVRGLAFRTRAVLLGGLGASIPWLALVWLAHAECRDLQDLLAGPACGSSAGSLTAQVIPRLLLLWKLLVSCVSAFALAVAAAIVNSGALRVAFITAHPDRGGQFPPSNVLLYGAFFAALLSVITIPLVASWRSCAFMVVEQAHPLPASGEPGEDWFGARARLGKLLHLDVPLLRNPLTALSVLTPLVTAALAAFIPQLGSG
jgi:hypothetical protein